MVLFRDNLIHFQSHHTMHIKLFENDGMKIVSVNMWQSMI